MIYFIRKGVDGPIKIGFTSTFAEKRMSQLQVGHHEPLYLLGTISGSISDEKSLHRELADYHIHGEWFEPKPELLATISDVIENQREWYYFRQVKTNALDVECKGLRALVIELREKIKVLEEEKAITDTLDTVKLKKTNDKLIRRIAKLTAVIHNDNKNNLDKISDV